ncbi:BrnA antitoxin family protein [Pseudotabrizicola formosa]|uniref:BrnA antitoxin family protein n=1 Tax=Pseudotabrizicola formosa TaxID=2030009 RepID=UPI00143DAADD|nr:BrnA antitoxin family protein [Pseudotabrizicola formosa]
MSVSNLKRMSLAELRARKGETDWDHLRKAGDYDGPEEFPVDWDKAVLVEPANKQMVSLRLDADILEFFKSNGKGYQTRMNAVLRAYVQAQKVRRP